MIYNTISQFPVQIVSYVEQKNIDKSCIIAYNIPIDNVGGNMDKNDGIFRPSKEELESAKIRLQERKKQGTTMGYQKYFKKLMKSYKDVRING